MHRLFLFFITALPASHTSSLPISMQSLSISIIYTSSVCLLRTTLTVRSTPLLCSDLRPEEAVRRRAIADAPIGRPADPPPNQRDDLHLASRRAALTAE